MTDQKSDEIHPACNTRDLTSQQTSAPIGEINRFFNELPVRILGTQDFPCFYLVDIGVILGLKRARDSIVNFGPRELVSKEQRETYGIVTYYKYKDTYRRDNSMILLTEYGVYRILFNTRTQLSERFRDFVYDVLHELRTKGEYKIKEELAALQIVNEQHLQKIGQLEESNRALRAKQNQFKNLCDRLHLIEYPINPYEREPTTLPAILLKKGAATKPPKYNTIDHPCAFVLADDELYSHLDEPFENISADVPPETRREIHARNELRARRIIDTYRSRTAYLVTDDPAPYITTETIIHSVWVKDAPTAMKALAAHMQDNRPRDISPGVNVYSCDKEKIINAMNAIAD